jgi:hypothetical protein
MSEPYIVEVHSQGCPQCGHDSQYDIVYIPEQTAESKSWGDKDEAEYIANLLNTAFERGVRSNKGTKAQINNFDVLKRMCADNLDIGMATEMLNMRKVNAGTQVTIGVPGDFIGKLFSGQVIACLLLYDKDQFNELKAKMEAE